MTVLIPQHGKWCSRVIPQNIVLYGQLSVWTTINPTSLLHKVELLRKAWMWKKFPKLVFHRIVQIRSSSIWQVLNCSQFTCDQPIAAGSCLSAFLSPLNYLLDSLNTIKLQEKPPMQCVLLKIILRNFVQCFHFKLWACAIGSLSSEQSKVRYCRRSKDISPRPEINFMIDFRLSQIQTHHKINYTQ